MSSTVNRKIAQSEGDVNTNPARQKWQAENLSDHTRQLIEEDAKYFLHQSLSTPCLNAIKSAEGAYIQDVEGRRYLDFHGNQVHAVGLGNEL